MAPASPYPFLRIRPGARLRISLALPSQGTYYLRVYDTAGRRVGVIADGAGYKHLGPSGETFWESDLMPGVYFLRLETDGRAIIRKLVIQ